MSIIRTGNVVDVAIPAWLYELLPLLYITGGVLAASKLGGGLVDLCSALLILAGIQILRMRADYRESMKHPSRARVRSRG